MKTIEFPKFDCPLLKIREKILIGGKIFCGRDAVLPKIVELVEAGGLAEKGIQLQGAVIFHTAVSPAGIGPTSSNKLEIESSIPALSAAGVKLHLGKGALKAETVAALKEHCSYFAVTPPVSALFARNIKSIRIVAFPELGMEALHEVEVEGIPAVIAIADGESIFD